MNGEEKPLLLGNHVLSCADFDDLAAGRGDVSAVDALWRSQRSRRLLLLRALLDEATNNPEILGPLPPTEIVWSVIEYDTHAHQRLESILLHPQVGSWLAYCHRLLRGGAASDSPLWIHIGQIHALAAAVAMPAVDHSYRGRVPVWRGRVLLPTLGSARVDGADYYGFAEAESGNGRVALWTTDSKIVIPDGDSPDWWPLRTIEVGGLPRLKVWLDDIDPFRDMADPVSPHRLNDAQFKHWHQLIADAWGILCVDDLDGAAAIAKGVRSVVPIPTAKGWGTRSASSGDAFGSVMVSLPPDATTMAVSLVHEFQHIKLGGLMHLVVLSTSDSSGHYAPWRDDPRPLGGFFQGVYAFLGISAFWRVRRLGLHGAERETADFEYLYARSQTEEALAVLANSTCLTEAGRRVTRAMVDRTRDWQWDDVSGRAVALVDIVAGAHRAGWRIRHLRPDRQTVAALVTGWLTGRSEKVPIGPSSVQPYAEQGWSHGRLGLARRILGAAESVTTPADLSGSDWAGSVTQADVDLVRGARAEARARYVELILVNHANPDAWTGLGLALGADGHPAGALLLRFPELVRDAYCEVTSRASAPPAPERFVAWIGDVTQALDFSAQE